MLVYDNPNSGNLLDIKIGSRITINDWDEPMIVRGVSDNYIIASDGRGIMYSVISRNPWELKSHNDIETGLLYRSPDDWIFGDPGCVSKYPTLYQFDDAEAIEYYLNQFETGKNHISERNGCSITKIIIE